MHIKRILLKLMQGGEKEKSKRQRHSNFLKIIISSCHAISTDIYPWPSLATPHYRSSLPVGPQVYTPYSHRAAVCRFKLATLFLHGHTDIDTRLTKAWTAINRLLVVWKSDLTDKMRRSFFQAVIVLILLYGCTSWTLTKQLKKKLDDNYTRMLQAILNKSCTATYHENYPS